jgi:hypothetical protein
MCVPVHQVHTEIYTIERERERARARERERERERERRTKGRRACAHGFRLGFGCMVWL